MKRLTKFAVLASVLMAAGTAPLCAQTAFVEGIYYQLSYPSDPSDGPVAKPYRPAGHVYTGELTMVSSFDYEGQTYSVTPMALMNEFTNSTVTEFTLGEGFSPSADYYISFRNDTALKRLTLKSGFSSTGNINVGNNRDCVDLETRKYKDRTEIRVRKFNVFGPDGERLTPFLALETNPNTRIYPDAEGVFHLDADFRYNGEYCVVLPVIAGNYIVVALNCEVNGGTVCVRSEPQPYQTDETFEVSGIEYKIWGDKVVVSSADGKDVVIPSTVTIDGEEYAVTDIAAGAFSGSDVESVVIPASVTTIARDSFAGCSTLRSVDFGAVKMSSFNLDFTGCTSLSEIEFPADMTALNGSFAGCESLTSLDFPETLTYIGSYVFKGCTGLTEVRMPAQCVVGSLTFDGCTDLYAAELVSSNSEEVRVRAVNLGIKDLDGNPLAMCAYTYAPDSYNVMAQSVRPDADGLYVLSRTPSVVSRAAGDSDFDTVYFGPAPDVQPGEKWNPSFFSLNVEDDTSGVLSLPAADDASAPVEIYNLQGMKAGRAATLAPGVYIRCQGGRASKFVVR